MLGGYPKQHSIKEINNNEFSSKSSLRSDVLRNNNSTLDDLTLSNLLLTRPRLRISFTIRTSTSRSILYLEDQDLLVNVCEHNRQLFQGRVQFSYSLSDTKYPESLDQYLPGLELLLELSLSKHWVGLPHAFHHVSSFPLNFQPSPLILGTL